MNYHDQTSSAMNYYEELGVSQGATGEEIRKAHRRLVKLMHPDAQLDKGLKSLAEMQMRRLNSIVSTLLDADQRRAYDEQLRLDAMTPAKQDHSTWRGMPWWLASSVGAVVFTLLAVWLWADHLSGGFGKTNHVILVRPVNNPPAATAKPSTVLTPSDPTLTANIGDAHDETANPPLDPPVPADPHSQGVGSADGVISATVVPPDSKSDFSHRNSSNAPAAVPAKIDPKGNAKVDIPAPAVQQPSTPDLDQNAKQAVASTEKEKKPFSLPPTALLARANSKSTRYGTQLPPPPVGLGANAARPDENAIEVSGGPLPTALAPRPDLVNVPPSRSGAGSRSHDPLEGEWIYAPKEPERRKAGFYPPEFIDLKLFSSGDPGNLHGQYNARYVITDKPISPEVSFQLASVDKESRKFVWQGTNGARGTVAIHPVDDNTIRIEWRTTTSVRSPMLTSGAATLVRRQ